MTDDPRTRKRAWWPGDVDGPVERVEAEYFDAVRDSLLQCMSARELQWHEIVLCHEPPDTQILAVFSSLRAPDRRYGLRFRVWPHSERYPSSDLGYLWISIDEYFADGIGADARFGRLETPPAEILWLND